MCQLIVLFISPLFITVVAPLSIYSIEPEILTDNKVENVLDLFEIPIDIDTLTVSEVGESLRYTFGKRVIHDRLVSQNTDKSYWTSPQNVTLILQYPGNGQGAIVTFVEVIVNQSSNIGAARVIAGGIGRRFIAAFVEGNRTYWFNYSASIYGI